MNEIRTMDVTPITLKQALEIFNRRDRDGQLVPFDIAYRTFNQTTKKGGALKRYERVKYLPPARPGDDKSIHNLLMPIKPTKNPNHHANKTRNIELANGDIRKLHIYFIDEINNCKVIY